MQLPWFELFLESPFAVTIARRVVNANAPAPRVHAPCDDVSVMCGDRHAQAGERAVNQPDPFHAVGVASRMHGSGSQFGEFGIGEHA